MRIKRTNQEIGGGSGRRLFRSNLFTVIEWHLCRGGGFQTEIEYESDLLPFLRLRFNGKQNFTSDKLCMEQLTMAEILRIIKHQKKQGFEEGKKYKIDQIRECLEINPTY